MQRRVIVGVILKTHECDGNRFGKLRSGAHTQSTEAEVREKSKGTDKDEREESEWMWSRKPFRAYPKMYEN